MADMKKETLVKLLDIMNTMLNANNEFMELLVIGGANISRCLLVL